MLMYGMDLIIALLFGVFVGNLKVYSYKRQLAGKAKPEYQTAEYILGKPYYIVPESEYVKKFL